MKDDIKNTEERVITYLNKLKKDTKLNNIKMSEWFRLLSSLYDLKIYIRTRVEAGRFEYDTLILIDDVIDIVINAYI
jgi:hypothetical protein